jgi:hypothetical protein
VPGAQQQQHSADTLKAAATSQWALQTALPRFLPQRVVLKCRTSEEAVEAVGVLIKVGGTLLSPQRLFCCLLRQWTYSCAKPMHLASCLDSAIINAYC